jgi:hypothetical protein
MRPPAEAAYVASSRSACTAIRALSLRRRAYGPGRWRELQIVELRALGLTLSELGLKLINSLARPGQY